MTLSFILYGGVTGFCLGIFFRSFFDIGVPYIVWFGTVGLVLLIIWSRKSKAFSAPYLLFLSLFFIFFSGGLLRMESAVQFETTSQLAIYVGTQVTITGTVVREPDIRSTTKQLYIDSGDTLLLVIVDRFTPVSYGDRVSVKGTLTKPESFETDLGRSFNYEGYLKARGVLYVVPFADVAVVQSGGGNPIITQVLMFKHAFMTRIESVIAQPQVGLAEGLLLGVKKALGEELETAFRKTGIMHIVVLSGYNIMLVVTFVTYLLAFALPHKGRLVCGLVAIVLFACMVGLSATVVRASCMAGLVLIANATGRTYGVVRALMLTGVVMLAINPYLLAFDVGFELSFIATLGLILVAPHVEKYVGFMPTNIGLREYLRATIATQIFVTPLLLYQIGEFSVVAVIVNILVLPMVPVAMLLTFITGMVAFVSETLALPFAYVSYLSLVYISAIAEGFAKVPFASFVVPAFPFYIVIFSYIFLGSLLWYLYTRTIAVRDTVTTWTIVEEFGT